MNKWKTIVGDPEFQSLQPEQKRKVLNGYVRDNVEIDPEYKKLPVEQKAKVLYGFERDAQITGKNNPFSPINNLQFVDIPPDRLPAAARAQPQPQPLPPPTQEEILAKEQFQPFGTSMLEESAKGAYELGKHTFEPFYRMPYDSARIVTDPISEAIQGTRPISRIPQGIEDRIVDTGLSMGEGMARPLGLQGLDAFKQSWTQDPYNSTLAVSPIVAPLLMKGVGKLIEKLPKKEPAISTEVKQAYSAGIKEIGQTLKNIPDEARPVQARKVADARGQMRSALFKNDLATINSIVDDFREDIIIPTGKPFREPGIVPKMSKSTEIDNMEAEAAVKSLRDDIQSFDAVNKLNFEATAKDRYTAKITNDQRTILKNIEDKIQQADKANLIKTDDGSYRRTQSGLPDYAKDIPRQVSIRVLKMAQNNLPLTQKQANVLEQLYTGGMDLTGIDLGVNFDFRETAQPPQRQKVVLPEGEVQAQPIPPVIPQTRRLPGGIRTPVIKQPIPPVNVPTTPMQSPDASIKSIKITQTSYPEHSNPSIEREFEIDPEFMANLRALSDAKLTKLKLATLARTQEVVDAGKGRSTDVNTIQKAVNAEFDRRGLTTSIDSASSKSILDASDKQIEELYIFRGIVEPMPFDTKAEEAIRSILAKREGVTKPPVIQPTEVIEKPATEIDSRVTKILELAKQNKDNPKKLADLEHRMRSVAASVSLNRPFGGESTPEQVQIMQQAKEAADNIAGLRNLQPVVTAKEPWQMTMDEYRQYIEDSGMTEKMFLTHEEEIKRSAAEGKPIPPEVLKDYPDLQPAPPTKAPTIKGKPKVSQPKMFEGEKVDITPKLDTEVQGQGKLFGTPTIIDKLKDETGAVGDLSKKLDRVKQSLINNQYDPSIPLSHYQQLGKSQYVAIAPKTPTQEAFQKLRKLLIDNRKGYDLVGGKPVKTDAEYLTGSKEVVSKINDESGAVDIDVLTLGASKLVNSIKDRVELKRIYKNAVNSGLITEEFPKDLTSTIKRQISYPETIAKRHPEFKPFYDTGKTYHKVIDTAITEDAKKLTHYYELPNKTKTNNALFDSTINDKYMPDNMLSGYGLSKDEIKAYKDVIETNRGIKNKVGKFLIEMGNDPEKIATFMQNWPDVYVPLSRYGEYFVATFNAKGETTSLEFYKTARQAKQEAASLVKSGQMQNVKTGKVFRQPQEAYEGIPVGILNILKQFDEEIGSNFSADYTKIVGRGFPTHLIHRKKTPGFSRDLEKAEAHYVMGVNRWMETKKIKQKFDALLKDGIDIKTKPQLWAYAKRYADYLTSNQKEGQKFRQLLFYYYMGANLKPALLNATQPLTTTYPMLSKYVSSPAVHLVKAYAESLKPVVVIEKTNPDLAKGLRQATNDGVIDEQMVNMIKGKAFGLLDQKNVFDKVVSIFFGTAERWNRKVSYIALYNAAREGKIINKSAMSHDEAHKLAEQFVDDTQFDYTKTNRPEIQRGWKSPFFVFRNYSGHYLKMLKELVREHEWGALSKAIAVMIGLGGIAAVPGIKDFERMLEFMGYDPKRAIKEKAGKWGDLTNHGLLYPLGIDISGAVGTAEVVPSDIQQGFLGNLARFTLGVPTDLYTRAERSYYMANKLKDPYRAVEAIMPEAVRNPMVAYRWAKEGMARTPSHEPLFKPSGMDIALKSVGIQPTNLSKVYEREHSEKILQDRVKSANENYAWRIAKAYINKDFKYLAEIRQEIKEHNKNVKNKIDIINPSSQSIKTNIYKMLSPEKAEIKAMPKKGRQEYLKLQETYR